MLGRKRAVGRFGGDCSEADRREDRIQNVRRLSRSAWWLALLVVVLGGVGTRGCQGEAARSQAGVEAWTERITEFYGKHQKLPNRLEELEELFASPEEFQRAMQNPVTGDTPGYEYVKPPQGVWGTALAHQVVMIYQLREGERASDLPVGYVAGRAGLLEPNSITDTVPHWEVFKPSEAPIQVEFPAPPRGHEESRPTFWSYRATFCGLDYILMGVQNGLFVRLPQEHAYKMMHQLCDALVTEHQARVRTCKELTLQSQPALSAELELPQYGHQLWVQWCLVGDRLYCLSVAGPQGALNEENAGTFFKSFRLVPP